MSSYYSIIRVCSNEIVGDSLAVGVIMLDGKAIDYHFFKNRVAQAKRMVKDASAHLGISLQNLEQNMRSKPEIFTLEKLEYLHTYSNGLLQFSAPEVATFSKTNEERFQELLLMLFGQEAVSQETVSLEKQKAKSLEHIVEKKLIEQVEGEVHTHIRFTPKKLPSLYFNIEVDCIGKNGSILGAKFQDFELGKQALDQNITKYLAFIPSILATYGDRGNKENQFYLLAEEPSLSSQQHKTWDALHKNELVQLLHPSESDKVVLQIKERKATTFL